MAHDRKIKKREGEVGTFGQTGSTPSLAADVETSLRQPPTERVIVRSNLNAQSSYSKSLKLKNRSKSQGSAVPHGLVELRI